MSSSSEEKIFLVLGCFGRKEESFVFCPSAQNRILKIDETLVYYEEIWDYFEGIKLVDKPMLDTNAIRHVVFNLQEKYDQKVKRLWTEYKFNSIERFIHMHKSCGLYLRLSLEEEEQVIESEEDESLYIKGVEVKESRVPISKVVRARR